MKKFEIYLMVIVILLVITPLVSADWAFNNVKRDLVIGDGISEYGKIEIDDWYGLKNLMSLELKTNSELCGDYCSANTEIIMYEDGKLIDEVRFLDLETGEETDIENYDIYVNGDLYDGEEVSGYSNGLAYDVELRGKVKPFQRVDWQIKSAGLDWIDDWAEWNSGLTNGSLAYWPFNEVSGTNVEDLMGNFNLTTNSSNWTTGIIKNALRFNHTAYVAYNDTFLDENQTDLSFSLWFRFDKDYNETGGSMHLFEKKHEHNVNLIECQAESASGRVYVNIEGEDQGGGIILYSNTTNWTANRWHHLVFVWKGYNNASLYIDGELNHTKAYTGTFNTSTLSNNWNIGGSDYHQGRGFNGTIDEFGVWNRTLTMGEITDLYHSGEGISPTGVNVTLNAPNDNLNLSNKSIEFSCTATARGVGLNVSNISLYHNESGTWTLNQTNLTTRLHNSTTTFDIDFQDYESIEWNCFSCDNNNVCEYGTNRTLNLEEVVINTETYNLTTYETDTEDFVVNVSGNGSVLTANLWYNGTSYTGTKTGNDYEAEFTRTFDIPTGTGNKSFYWEILSGGFNTINSTELNQTIDQTLLGLCNATLTIPYINFTFQDEANSTETNGSIDITTWNYYLGTGAYNKTLTFSNTSENPSYAFCFTPEDKTLNHDVVVQYYGTGYPQRRWTYDTDLTNTTLNQTLYLLQSTDGIYSVYQVQTNQGSPISGVTVQVERQFSGTWTLVEQGTSDSAGAVTFWLNPDYDHRLTFTKVGYTSLQETIRPSSSTYTVIMGSGVDEDVGYNSTESLEGIKYVYSPASGRLSKDTVYTFTFNVTSSLSNLLNYSIRLVDESDVILNRTSGTTATGGNLSITLNTSTADKIWGKYYVDVGAGMVVIDSDAYWITNITDYTPERGTLWHFFYYSSNLSEFGGEDNRAEFSRIVAFFLILTILLSALCFMTGWDAGSPGGILTLITGIIWIGSFSGFLTLTGITPWNIMDKYSLAFMITLIWIGYSANTIRRQTS